MIDLTNLITRSDYLLLLVYAILGYLLLRFLIFKKMNSSFYLIMKLFFTLKVLSLLLMCLLTVYYWKEADAIYYYGEGRNLLQLMKANFVNIKYFFLPVENYQNLISLDNELIKTYNGSGSESSFFVSKFCALLYPFAMGRYLLVNFFFCLLSTIAQLKLFIVLSKRYPHLKGAVSICILFMPTLLLYSTPIFKETLCLTFIGLGAYHLYQITKKEFLGVNILLLILNLFLIFMVKPYVVYAIILPVFFILLTNFIIKMAKGTILSKLFIFFILTISLYIFFNNLDFFDPYIITLTDTSNFFQEQYSTSLGESSSFSTGEIETTFAGLLKKLPVSTYTTYFRPHIWESGKAIILFSALECFFIFCLAILAIFKNGRNLFQLFGEDIFVRFIFLYSIILGCIIGLTTFNFGTLIRYKVPGVPFFWLFIFILYYYTPKKIIENKI